MATFLKSLNLKIRLTILFALIFGTTTLVFSAFIYYSLNDSLLSDFDDALYNYAIDVTKSIDSEPSSELITPLLPLDEEKIFPFSSGTSLILVRHISGEILSQTDGFGDYEFPYLNQMAHIAGGADSAYTTLTDLRGIRDPEAKSYRLLTFPLDSAFPPQFYLQIAVPMTTFEYQLKRLNLIITIGFPCLLLLAITLGLYFSSRAMRPIQNLIESTNKIDMQNLSARVELPLPKDEIRTLAQTQNDMLDRLERAFKSQERFISDASHQLLTPLTVLRVEIELKLNSAPTGDRAFYGSLLQETDKLAKIVKDMLLLARIESGTTQIHFHPVNVDEILLDVVSRLQKHAEKKHIRIVFSISDGYDRFHILGEEDLLHNLFANILENAIKYSTNNSEIRVVLSSESDETRIGVIDKGEGIPETARPFIFDRFSRYNKTTSTKGYGLGLSIAKKIADIHGFTVELVPEPLQSTHIRIRMPHRKKSAVTNLQSGS